MPRSSPAPVGDEVTQGHTQDGTALPVLKKSLLPGWASKATLKRGQQTVGFPPWAFLAVGGRGLICSEPTFDRGHSEDVITALGAGSKNNLPGKQFPSQEPLRSTKLGTER